MRSLLLFVIFLASTIALSAQTSAKKLSGIYYIDRLIVGEKENSNTASVSSARVNSLEKDYFEQFLKYIPEYVKNTNISSTTNTPFVGISSPFYIKDVPNAIEVINSQKIGIAIEEKSAEIERALTKARVNILKGIEKVSNDLGAHDLVKVAKAYDRDTFFDISNDGINTTLDNRLSNALLDHFGENYGEIKDVIKAELDPINKSIADFGKGYERMITYEFSKLGNFRAIKHKLDKNLATYESLRNSSPLEAVKILKQNEIILGLIDQQYLGKVERIANDVSAVIDGLDNLNQVKNEIEKGWAEIEGVLKGEIDLARLSLGKLTTGSFEDIFIGQDFKVIEAEQLYYSALGVLDGPLSNVLGVDRQEISEAARMIGGVGFGIARMYAGDIFGGAMSVIGGLFGGSRRKSSGTSALANTMVKGFNQVFEGQRKILEGQVTIVNNQKLIVDNQRQLSDQISEMHKQMITNDTITWSLIENLHQQIIQNDSLIVSILTEIDSKVANLHVELRQFHSETRSELATIQQKLNTITNQNNCIASAIQEANLEAFKCRSIMENDLIEATKAGRITSIEDYSEYFVSACIKGLEDLPNKANPATLSLDFNKCLDSGGLGEGDIYDPKALFAMLRDLWNEKYGGSQYNLSAAYVALLNPTLKVDGNKDVLIARSLRRAKGGWYKNEDLLNGVNVINKMDPDAFNNMNAVIDITTFYLYALPMLAKSGSLGEELINEKEYGAYLKKRVIQNAVKYYKQILEITMAQQSLMSGTMLLSHIKAKLSSSQISRKEKMKWVDAIRNNQYLAFNFLKYMHSTGTGYSKLIGKDFKVEFFKNRINFSELDNGKYNTVFKIQDSVALELVYSPDRVLPNGFYQMIDLHKKYLILDAELKTLKTLKRKNLITLKELYLN